MGKDVNDVGIGPDRAAGVTSIRLYLGHGGHGIHHPSPTIGRREVVTLWRWTLGQGALPDILADWWLSLPEDDREDVRALLQGLRPLTWAALWQEAGPDDAQPPHFEARAV